jgi:hypothetical protein
VSLPGGNPLLLGVTLLLPDGRLSLPGMMLSLLGGDSSFLRIQTLLLDDISLYQGEMRELGEIET